MSNLHKMLNTPYTTIKTPRLHNQFVGQAYLTRGAIKNAEGIAAENLGNMRHLSAACRADMEAIIATLRIACGDLTNLVERAERELRGV